MPPDTPAPDTPRRRFIALLDGFSGWLEAEKEKGAETVAANPALARALKDPLPEAPDHGRPPASPAELLILFAVPPGKSDEEERLLDKMIASLGLAPGETALVRTGPESGPLLRERLTALRPKVAVIMDEAAWRNAVGPGEGHLAKNRGAWKSIDGVPAMPTHGPAHLLARPADKVFAWQDLQAALAKVGRKPPPIRKKGP